MTTSRRAAVRRLRNTALYDYEEQKSDLSWLGWRERVGSYKEDSCTSKDEIRICDAGISALSSFSLLVVFIESHNQPAL
jgi:hypothetical protein